MDVSSRRPDRRAITTTSSRTAPAATAPARSTSEPSRSHAFDEREEQARDEEARSRASAETNATRRRSSPGSARAESRSSSDQYPSSAVTSEPGGDERRCTVERRVVDRELRRVHAPQHDERRGKERRPPEDERAHEEEQGERRDTKTDLDEGVLVSAGERQRGERDRAEDGSGPCG